MATRLPYLTPLTRGSSTLSPRPQRHLGRTPITRATPPVPGHKHQHGLRIARGNRTPSEKASGSLPAILQLAFPYLPASLPHLAPRQAWSIHNSGDAHKPAAALPYARIFPPRALFLPLLHAAARLPHARATYLISYNNTLSSYTRSALCKTLIAPLFSYVRAYSTTRRAKTRRRCARRLLFSPALLLLRTLCFATFPLLAPAGRAL